MKKRLDTTGASLKTGFAPVPEGIYQLVIREVADTKNGEPWKTKNGDDYVRVTCEIDDQGNYFGRKIWYGLTFMDDISRPGAGMSVHFLKAIGEPWDGPVDIDTDRWIGRVFKAKLKIVKDQNGEPKNEVGYVLSEEEASEEVPF